jgi:hypothetical protein
VKHSYPGVAGQSLLVSITDRLQWGGRQCPASTAFASAARIT